MSRLEAAVEAIFFVYMPFWSLVWLLELLGLAGFDSSFRRMLAALLS